MNKLIIIDSEKWPENPYPKYIDTGNGSYSTGGGKEFTEGQQSLLALGKPIEEYYKWLDEMAGKWYNDMANGRITISLSQYLIQEGKK